MARTASAIINLSVRSLIKNPDADGLGDPGFVALFTAAVNMKTGTGLNQSDRVISSFGRTLAQSASESIDVHNFTAFEAGASGAGNDALGQAVALVDITVLGVRIHPTSETSASLGTLLVGNDGTAAAWNSMFGGADDAAITLLQGGVMVVIAPPDPGYAVADSTNHLLKIAEGGVGAVTFDLLIAGRSA